MYILVPTWGWFLCPAMTDPACVWPVPFSAGLNLTKFCLHGRFTPLRVLSRDSLLAQMVKNLTAMQENRVWSLGWEDPLEKGMATHYQYCCLGNSMHRGAWQAAVHGVTSVRHDLLTKPRPPGCQLISSENWSFTFWLLEASTVLVSVCMWALSPLILWGFFPILILLPPLSDVVSIHLNTEWGRGRKQ